MALSFAPIDPTSEPPVVGGSGFPKGSYFLIQSRRTGHVLSTYTLDATDGTQLLLLPREAGEGLRSQIFYTDDTGALYHLKSGFPVDIIDALPVIRRRRPESPSPNPWSHPLPQFSFANNSQIRVKFLSNPAFPACSDNLYPNELWQTSSFVIASHSEKDFHDHAYRDYAPWRPAIAFGELPFQFTGDHDKQKRVLVEEAGVLDGRTQWDIIPAPGPLPTYKAKAIYDYTASADDPNEMSFSLGEILNITEKEANWWQAEKGDGTTGIVPSNFLKLI